MRPTLHLAVLLLALPLAAQTAPCASANDSNNTFNTGSVTAFGFAGAGNYAYQYTPAVPIVAQAMRIITARPISTASGFMSLEIWSDASGLPGARLAGGSWKTDFGPASAVWQGTNFDAPVVMLPATNYWLVWIEPHSSNLPVEPGGATLLPAAYRAGTGAWATRTPAAFKFRLYCSLLDDINVVVNGTGCPSSTGAQGTLFANQMPTVGNADFRVEGTGFPSASLAVLALGVIQGFPSFPLPGLPAGCQQNTDILRTLVVGITGTGDVRATTRLGHVSSPLPIPANPALVGLYLATQLAVFDAANTAPIPLVTSNALQLTLY